jgi:hypothetical protein
MPYGNNMSVPYKFLELCKYQQEIIKQYEEYIEKHIHAKILEADIPSHDLFGPREITYRRITIPETTLMIKCDPYILKEWNWLKAQTPLISPNYFLHVAYQEQQEQEARNAKAN